MFAKDVAESSENKECTYLHNKVRRLNLKLSTIAI